MPFDKAADFSVVCVQQGLGANWQSCSLPRQPWFRALYHVHYRPQRRQLRLEAPVQLQVARSPHSLLACLQTFLQGLLYLALIH